MQYDVIFHAGLVIIIWKTKAMIFGPSHRLGSCVKMPVNVYCLTSLIVKFI